MVMTTVPGFLYEPRRSAHILMSSSAVTGVVPSTVVTAHGVSPHCSLGTPNTAASITAGWSVRTFSSSAGQMLYPPEMIMSSLRSTT